MVASLLFMLLLLAAGAASAQAGAPIIRMHACLMDELHPIITACCAQSTHPPCIV